MSKFGDMVRKAREDMDISQRTLSFMTGISNAEISRIESGKRRNPSVETITRLSGYLNGIEISDAIKAVFEDSLLLSMNEESNVEEDILFEDNEEEFDPKEVLGIYSTAYLLKVSPEILCEWIRTGDMAVTAEEGLKRTEYRITDDNIKDFVKRHPMYFSRALDAGIYNEKENNNEPDSKMEFTIWAGSPGDYPIVVEGDKYEDSGKNLLIFNSDGHIKAVFVLSNIIGYVIKRLESD